MRHSIRLTLTTVALIGSVGTGIYFGRAFGSVAGRAYPSYSLSSLAPLHASLTEKLAQDPNPDIPPEQVFHETLERIQKDFVEGTGTDSRLTDGALSRMIASLDDPKTFYLSPSFRKIRRESFLGRYQGIGANLIIVKTGGRTGEERRLQILSVAPGSPAEKQGLRRGDIITQIDDRKVTTATVPDDLGRNTNQKSPDEPPLSHSPETPQTKTTAHRRRDLSLVQALATLSSGTDTQLKLKVIRGGSPTPMEVLLKSAKGETQPVDFQISPENVGILRVRQFNAIATRKFQEAIKPGLKLKGLVVDLRGNSGGVYSQEDLGIDGFASARKLLAALTKGGKIAMIERRPNQMERLQIQGASEALQFPMTVLIDSGTSNLAEMTASALRETAGAKLIGERTNGDDSLRLFAPLSNGAGIEMTAGRLFTTKGVDLSKGLDPDFPVLANSPRKDQDDALKLALKKIGEAGR